MNFSRFREQKQAVRAASTYFPGNLNTNREVKYKTQNPRRKSFYNINVNPSRKTDAN
jgi:hypothetical protein